MSSSSTSRGGAHGRSSGQGRGGDRGRGRGDDRGWGGDRGRGRGDDRGRGGDRGRGREGDRGGYGRGGGRIGMLQGAYAPQGSHAPVAPPYFSTSPVVVAGSSSSAGGSGLDSGMSKLSIRPYAAPSTVAVPTSTKAVKLPPRPGFGRSGNKTVVMANHFMVSLKNPEMDVFHYDVSIVPELTSRCLNRMVMSEFVKSYRESHLGNRLPAYDGRKNMYTAGVLPFQSKEFAVYLEREDGSRRQREFKVTVKFAVKIDFYQLLNFLQSKQMDSPVDVIQCLDIVLRSAPTENHLSVGRSFFSLNFAPAVQLGNGVECWKGYYQSLRPTQMGLSLNIDLSATSFFEPLNVVTFIERNLAVKYMPRKPMSDSDRTKVRRVLRGVRVAGMHRPGHKIQYRITGISPLSANKLMFDGPDGVEISVARFFQVKYNVNLKYGDWPCLKAGSDTKPSYLPMEVCQIVQGQRYVKKLNENQVRQMLTSTCIRPSDRKNNISQTVANNGYSNDAFLKEFGLNVSTNLTKVDARILPAPELIYKDKNGRETVSRPRFGAWNMINMQIVEGGMVDGWACLNFSRNTDDIICKFTRTLVGKCQNMGMKFRNTDPLFYKSEHPNKVASALQDAADYFRTDLKEKHLQLMIVVLPEASGLYGKIKTICETDLGIVTQCCKPRPVNECKGQYQENLALKINVKVGGRNTFVSNLKGFFPGLVGAPRNPNQQIYTIIFGADVTHPAPGDDTSPSIAAVVASMEWPNVTRYRCLLSSQLHRDEIIHDLYKPPTTENGKAGGMIRDHLVAFYKATCNKPCRILFYRDGVSEGQFNQVLLLEMDAIRKACQSLDPNYLPTVTFVVVQKRHHTRLFPVGRDCDKSGNVLAGTVVDTTICHPTEFDFYLCSHTGIKGTSRPTHYHVLYDENKFSADQLQMLTNSLCYTYARCTRSVSIVPPAYYAHLAAFRARYYIEEEMSATASTGGGTEARVLPRVLPQIKDCVNGVMFFC